jgi:thymidylate kinase
MEDRAGLERYEEPEFDPKLRAAYADAAELLRRRGDRIEAIDASRPVPEVLSDLLARLDATS